MTTYTIKQTTGAHIRSSMTSADSAEEAAEPRGARRRQGGAMTTLGTTTTYDGTEHAYLRGHKVRIVAVLKNALRADYDPDRDGQYIRDEEDLERAGGVTADDRVEVQPWLAAEGRFSFVSSDPRAIDLACFASLKR